MAAQHHHQQDDPKLNCDDDDHYSKLLSSYLGLSFTVFLGFLPQNTIPLLPSLQSQNQALSLKLLQAEEELRQLHSRRKEDSKANARVVEIFASHRHAWQQEEKRLLQQIDDCNEEIEFFKNKLEEFEGVEAELKREIGEREEILNFMSRSNYEVENGDGECYRDAGLRYGKVGVSEECFNGDQMGSVYGGQSNSDFLNSAASGFWTEKTSLWQDVQQYEHPEPVYHMKHYVSRRESPWKVDGDSTGVSSKLKLLEQELLNLERVCKPDLSKLPSQLRKQAKRYQALSGKIDDLCRRMQACDSCEATLSSEFRTQRQTEFLREAVQLQHKASETNQKLMALQSETGKNYHGEELDGPAKLATRRSMDSISNNFKDIQRNLEIWLARIAGDLEGVLARDGASRAREYYVSRYPFVR